MEEEKSNITKLKKQWNRYDACHLLEVLVANTLLAARG